MNMAERTERMKKFIFMNNIVIIIQIVLVALSVIFNFLIDDFAVFITVFIHIAIFVLYNIVVESIVEYGYLRKKFVKICDETHYLRYFELKKRMYRASKNKKDMVSSKLILQSAIKSFIAVLSIISILFMIPFE
ncbi:MAG: hypothetical protein IJ279_05940 [Clostridia bacterium]|nr:hypothetical protein [Clostridia bacterium]